MVTESNDVAVIETAGEMLEEDDAHADPDTERVNLGLLEAMRLVEGVREPRDLD
jgi:hypothetical protein